MIESDALYALTYLAVALRTARWHWEAIGQREKWRIFDALVLAHADPDSPRPTREQLLAEFPGRDKQYLDNCATTVKRSIQALLPLILPAEMSDRPSSDERFAEWKEILGDGHLSALGWLRWAVPVDWTYSIEQCAGETASVGLAVDAGDRVPAGPVFLFDEDDTSELPPEHEHDRLRVAQSVILSLPFAVYLGQLDTAGATGAIPRPAGHRAWHAWKTHSWRCYRRWPNGARPQTRLCCLSRMEQLKHYGKRAHHAATRALRQPATAPAPPRVRPASVHPGCRRGPGGSQSAHRLARPQVPGRQFRLGAPPTLAGPAPGADPAAGPRPSCRFRSRRRLSKEGSLRPRNGQGGIVTSMVDSFDSSGHEELFAILSDGSLWAFVYSTGKCHIAGGPLDQ